MTFSGVRLSGLIFATGWVLAAVSAAGPEAVPEGNPQQDDVEVVAILPESVHHVPGHPVVVPHADGSAEGRFPRLHRNVLEDPHRKKKAEENDCDGCDFIIVDAVVFP